MTIGRSRGSPAISKITGIVFLFKDLFLLFILIVRIMVRSIASPMLHAALAATAVLGLAALAGPPLRTEATVQTTSAPAETFERLTGQPKALIPVDVLRVVDGDTLEVRAHVWLDQTIVTRVRLRGIDAPDFRTGCPAEATKAEASRSKLEALAGRGQLHLTAMSRDKYGGRIVGDLVTPDGASIARAMLTTGHARSYTGGKRQNWC
jgi:micrococcal nuclease